MPISVFINPLVAALVGCFGTLALIVAAGQTVWATPQQLASWITAICLALAATSAIMSWRTRLPIVTAWSTPGAALIAASTGVTAFSDAVGAFVLAAVLLLLTALIRPLGQLVQRIPASLAAAMLAGVLLPFVLAVFRDMRSAEYLVLPLVLVFLVARRLHPSTAVLVTLGAGLGVGHFMGLNGDLASVLQPPTLQWVTPTFEAATLIGLGVPLYLVTMASQNLPGFAVLRSAGYTPPVGPLLGATGLASLLTAPFGAHTSNMAAITASICTGPDTHPDAFQRWKAGVAYGGVYVILALAGASLIGIVAALPAPLIITVVGLALAAPLMQALGSAMQTPAERFPALLTFVVTASGLSFMGVGSAFWGLLAGLLAWMLERRTKS